jgi:hypothetical protein
MPMPTPIRNGRLSPLGIDAEAVEEWTIKHFEEQLYDIVSMLDYDAKDVKMWGPNATDPTTVEQEEWRETFETVEPGERLARRRRRARCHSLIAVSASSYDSRCGNTDPAISD